MTFSNQYYSARTPAQVAYATLADFNSLAASGVPVDCGTLVFDQSTTPPTFVGISDGVGNLWTGGLTIPQQVFAQRGFGRQTRANVVVMGDSRMAKAFDSTSGSVEWIGSIVGGVLSVTTAIVGGTALNVGDFIFAVGIPVGTYVSSVLTGQANPAVGSTFQLSIGNSTSSVSIGVVTICSSPMNFMRRYGFLTPLNNLLGARFNYLANLSTGSSTVNQALNNQLPICQYLASNGVVDYVFFESAYNNLNAGDQPAQIIATYTQVLNGLLSTGAQVVLFTDQPGNLSSSNQTSQEVFNSWLMTQSSPRVWVINTYNTVLGNSFDSSAGQMYSGYRIGDAVHTNTTGAQNVALPSATQLDPLTARLSVFSQTFGAYNQLVYNPNVDGNNATGSNGWLAGTGVTGNGPSNWNAICSGTASAVCSKISRGASALVPVSAKNNSGDLLNVAVTGGAAFDKVTIGVGPTAARNIVIENRPQNTAIGINASYRIRPSVANGCQYLVNNTPTGGTTANVVDPSSAWSTTIGATQTDGTVNYTVVPSIDIGDQIYAVAEVYCDSPYAQITGTISTTTLTVASVISGTVAIGMYVRGAGVAALTLITAGSGSTWTVSVSQTVSTTTAMGLTMGGGIYLNLLSQNSGFSLVGLQQYDGYFDSGQSMPQWIPQIQTFRTPVLTLLTGAQIIVCNLVIQMPAGGTANFQIGQVEIRKVGT